MLYRLGFIVLFLSTAVESDSVLAPLVVATIGIVLMAIGNGKESKHEAE